MKRLILFLIDICLLLFLFFISSAYSQNTEWVIYSLTNSGLPANNVNSVVIDGSGAKWIATGSGLAVYDGEIWTVYNTSNSDIPDYLVYSIAIEGNGLKWIGTFDGLASFDGATWTIYNSSNSDLPNNTTFNKF